MITHFYEYVHNISVSSSFPSFFQIKKNVHLSVLLLWFKHEISVSSFAFKDVMVCALIKD